jgi:hypothetical protein
VILVCFVWNVENENSDQQTEATSKGQAGQVRNKHPCHITSYHSKSH